MRSSGRRDLYLDEISEARAYPSPHGDAERMTRDRTGRARGERRWLVAAFALWALYFAYLWPRMLFARSDGLYAGWRTVWADWVVHFAYANAFAYRRVSDWFAINPIYAESRFDYPFLADGLSGILMRFGVDRIDAFVLPSLAVSLALVAVLVAFYQQVLRSPRLVFLACALFFANGGMGFVAFADELAHDPAWETLLLPPHEYTYFPDQHVWWINIVSSELLPQRALLFGLPLGLAVLIALRRWAESDFARASLAKIAALGGLTSILVITHMHSFLALVVLCACYLLFDRRNARRWLLFAACAGLPSGLLFALVYAGSEATGAIAWYPGWLTHPSEPHDISLWLFLWLNWGVFLPLAAVAVLRFRSYRDPLVAGALVLFALCFLVRFQANVWDNTKLLTWSHLLLCAPVARYLGALGSRPALISRFTAVALFAFAVASGALDLLRISRTDAVANRMWTSEEIALADAFRAVSEPTSLVLCSDDHHHWVPALSGRQILLGYRGWLSSYALDYRVVERDVLAMLSGAADAEALFAQYGVEFVVIGESERRDFAADASYFERRHELILEGAGNQVFRVLRPRDGESDRR
jgi:uncharacterized membrane protein YobD (UPF0266 family)